MGYIEEAIKSGVKAGLLNAMSAMPAIIKSFDAAAQTITAEVAIMRIVEGKNEAYPVLVDIPILVPSVQGFHITMPIKPGDECLLIFADRCIDNWFTSGGIQPQLEHRAHHISDGFALVGINSAPNAIPGYSASDMVIRNTANDQKVTLKASGDIDISTSKNVNVNCSSATVKATAVTIDSPTTKVTGALDVTGPITSAASVTAPMVTGSTNVIMGGISGTAHVHGGVQTGLGTTGTPQ